ncbi:MAG: 50S ribosomal protein L27 [Candidatus Hodgkinia cicadicola]
MAHKRTGGACKNGRDSRSKRLGVKTYGRNLAKPGCILVRRRGPAWKAGKGATLAKDYTIVALVAGQVTFSARGRDVSVI